MNFWRFRSILLVIVALFGCVEAARAADLVQANDSTQTNDNVRANDSTPLCRFGVNLSEDAPITTFDTTPLRIGWYIDYHKRLAAARPQGIDYTPMVRLRQTGPLSYTVDWGGSTITDTVAANGGADWLIGNEPDRRVFQDDIEPPVYALAWHDLYHAIKTLDPTARLFAGSIVQATPLRLRYLDLVLESYQSQFGSAMPVDGWSIHGFVLNEASCAHYNDLNICWGADIPPGVSATDGLRIGVQDNDSFELFQQQIVAFRQWMAKHGYAERPLYLTEYGVLMPAVYGFASSRVNAFMNRSFEYLLQQRDRKIGYAADDGRLVQRFSWYSTSDKANFNGYLYEKPAETAPYQLSAMGTNYAAFTANVTATVDLVPVSLTVLPSPLLTATEASTLTVQATIANAGHALAATSATVRFIATDASGATTVIGTDQPVTLAGCGKTASVAVPWPAVAPGTYTVSAVIDPDALVVESVENNNARSQGVFTVKDRNFLPIIKHD